MVIHDDNLNTMRGMESKSVDLCYADPPFNTGKDWGQFDDRWEGGLDGYLHFMKPRLAEIHRLLKDTGSLYLHCDTNASHYLKVMLDGIFGICNFKNEIVWRMGWVSGFKSKTKGWIRNHDKILYHVKNNTQYIFNKLYIPYRDGYLRRGEKPTGEGIPVEDTWNCSVADEMNSIFVQSWDKERKGYPTQKPVALLERIIKASSNQHDTVLDPFCGSGTTLVAAHKLGRKFIGIDSSEEAVNLTNSRLESERLTLFEGI